MHIIDNFKCWLKFYPPGALTAEGWRHFDKEFKKKAPIRHWIDSNFKEIFVYPIKWKYEAISRWLRVRTFDRYHVLYTGLPPGYREIDEIMLHANFELLRNFVEVELANKYFWCSNEPKSWAMRHMPFYDNFYPADISLGVKHLEWESTLDDPTLPVYDQSERQAVNAREILFLYKWWTIDRRLRQPIELNVPHTDDLFGFDIDTPENREYIEDIRKSDQQAAEWDQEDTTMLVRLVKIRAGMWS